MSKRASIRCFSWPFSACLFLVCIGCQKKTAEPDTLSPYAEGAAEIQKLGQSGHWSSFGDGADGRMVNLTHSPLTDDQLDGLLRLEVFQDVRDLHIGHCRVTDKGLEHLKRLSRLERLSLQGNEITDAGLEHLSTLESLQDLNLYKTNITDQGLMHLAGLPALDEVDVRRTDVTEDGAKRLQEAVPQCQIKF